MNRLMLVTALLAGGALAGALVTPLHEAHGAYPAPLAAPTEKGVAASAAADASRAAAELLRKGGNAIDGAVAAALALGVVDPESSGLGGGGYAVVWLAKEHKARVLDFREVAPAAASRDMFLSGGKADAKKSKWGGLAVAVPAEPAGLAELEAKYGRLGLRAAVQPAVRLARDGFAAPRHLVGALAPPPGAGPRPGFDDAPLDDHLRALLYPGGKPVVEGQRLARPDLARTLSRFGERGAAGFYEGTVAETLVAAVRQAGGNLTLADLKAFKPTWREPLAGHFRGHDVFAIPPPGGGVTALEILQILDAKPPLAAALRGSSAHYHLLLEAFKHAFADRARSLGDPAFVEVPTARLADPGYAKELAARLRDDQVLKPEAYGDKSLVPAPVEAPRDHGTSHLCVADREGNVVALTTTVNLYFGARFIAGSTGVVMNDQMDDFSAQPGVPNAFGLIGAFANAIAPGKRPLSSMTPMILTKDGQAVLCVGAAGGPTIVTATVQTIVNAIDFGLDVESAVAAPRVHAQWMPEAAFVERDVPKDVVDALTKRGHKVKVQEGPLAAVHAIALTPAKLTAASDPRYGGAPAAP